MKPGFDKPPAQSNPMVELIPNKVRDLNQKLKGDKTSKPMLELILRIKRL